MPRSWTAEDSAIPLVYKNGKVSMRRGLSPAKSDDFFVGSLFRLRDASSQTVASLTHIDSSLPSLRSDRFMTIRQESHQPSCPPVDRSGTVEMMGALTPAHSAVFCKGLLRAPGHRAGDLPGALLAAATPFPVFAQVAYDLAADVADWHGSESENATIKSGPNYRPPSSPE